MSIKPGRYVEVSASGAPSDSQTAAELAAASAAGATAGDIAGRAAGAEAGAAAGATAGAAAGAAAAEASGAAAGAVSGAAAGAAAGTASGAVAGAAAADTYIDELINDGVLVGTFAWGTLVAVGGETTIQVEEPVTEAGALTLLRNGFQQVGGAHFTANGSDIITLGTAAVAGDVFYWIHTGGRATSIAQSIVNLKGTGSGDGNLARAALAQGVAQGKAVTYYADVALDGVVPGWTASLGLKDVLTDVFVELDGAGPGVSYLASTVGLTNLVRFQNMTPDSRFRLSDMTLDGTIKTSGTLLSFQDASNIILDGLRAYCGGLTDRYNDNSRGVLFNASAANIDHVTITNSESEHASSHGFAISGSGTQLLPHCRFVQYVQNRSLGPAGSGFNASSGEFVQSVANLHIGELDPDTGNYVLRYGAFRFGNEGAFFTLTGNMSRDFYRGERLADVRYSVSTGNVWDSMGAQALVVEEKDSEAHHIVFNTEMVVDPMRGYLWPLPDTDGEEEINNTVDRMGVYLGGGSRALLSDTIVTSDWKQYGHGVITCALGNPAVSVLDNTEIGSKISAFDRRVDVGSLIYQRAAGSTAMTPIWKLVGKLASKALKVWYASTDGTGRGIGLGDSRVPEPNLLLDADPFTTISGNTTVTVNKVAHGLTAGQSITFYGVANFNGLDFLDESTGRPTGPYTVGGVTPDTFTIVVGTAPTASGSGGGAACCAKVTLAFPLTTLALTLGSNPFLTAVDALANNPLTTSNPTLTNNPLTTTAGSTTLQVYQVAHGKAVGERVQFSGATAVGGLSAANINNGVKSVIAVIDADTYWVTAPIAATSAATGGGAAVAVGSSRVIVTQTAHGKATGDKIRLSGATDTGGITAVNLNVTATITVIDANSYSFVTSPAASSCATSAATGGGAAVLCGSDKVTVTHTAHGMITGAWINYRGPAASSSIPAFNGVDLNGQRAITVINANSYTVKASAPATAAGSGGGSSVAYLWVAKSAGQTAQFDGDALVAMTSEPWFYTTPQLQRMYYTPGTGSLSVTDGNTAMTGTGAAFTTQLIAGANIQIYDGTKQLIGEFLSASGADTGTLVAGALRTYSGPFFFAVPQKMAFGVLVDTGHDLAIDYRTVMVDGATESPIQVQEPAAIRAANVPRTPVTIPGQTITTDVDYFVAIPADMEELRHRPVSVRVSFLGALTSPSSAGWAYIQLVRVRAGVAAVMEDAMIKLGLTATQALGDVIELTFPDTPLPTQILLPGDMVMARVSPFGTGRAIPTLGVEVRFLPW